MSKTPPSSLIFLFISTRGFCLFFLIASLLSCPLANAQECDPNSSGTGVGCFSIQATYNGVTQTNISRVCVGNAIGIVQCAPSKGGSILNVRYDYGDSGTPNPTSQTTHTYTQPGTYTILQQGTGEVGSGITCISLRKQIVVLPTPPPVFTLTTCSGQAVLLTIPDNDPANAYDNYLVGWGDGTNSITPASALQHPYATAGAKTVTVTGRYSSEGCGNAASQSVTPTVALVAPTYQQLEVKNDNTAELQFTASADYLTYEIRQRVPPSANYQTISALANITGTQMLKMINLNNIVNTYCFNIIASDACGKPFDLGEICTVRLQDTAQNGQNVLQWPVYNAAGFTGYDIYRDNRLIRTIGNANVTQFVDADVQCSGIYCYRLEVRAGSYKSISLPRCVTAVSTRKPDVPEDFTATIQEGKTVLIWKKPTRFAVKTYLIGRSENGGVFSNYTLLAARAGEFTDTQLSSDTTRYCYRISYTDSCGNSSGLSSIACPIRLRKITPAAPADAYQLSWNAYITWPSGVSNYVVEKLDEQGNVLESADVGLNLAYKEELDTIHQRFFYRIKAVSNDALPLVSYSNLVEYRQELRVFLPDAFTPNEDGLNDTYAAKGLFIRSFRMQVYNRWGELIFVSDRLEEGWDGNFNGKLAPAESYGCRIELEDYLGRSIQKNKAFVLIR